MSKVLTPTQFADQCREQAFKQFGEGDEACYASLCKEYGDKHGLVGFDFFTHAVQMRPELHAWKPFITDLRKMGRMMTLIPASENKESAKMSLDLAYTRVTLMGKVVTPTIVNRIFPVVMRRAFPNVEKCTQICKGLFDTIIREEEAIKAAETQAAIAAAVDLGKIQVVNLTS